MRARRAAVVACFAIVAAACGSAQSSPCSAPTGAPAVTQQPTAAPPATLGPTSSPAAPEGTTGLDAWKDPTNFVAVIDNPWLPLKPGTVLHYTGNKDGERAKVVTNVTGRTEVAAGATC